MNNKWGIGSGRKKKAWETTKNMAAKSRVGFVKLGRKDEDRKLCKKICEEV